jgi:hypothetical protein
MDDFLPLRPPSRANADNYHANVWNGGSDESHRSAFMGVGGKAHTSKSVDHDCATFEMPESAREIRELLTEDLPTLTMATRPKRVINQRRGTRVNGRAFERWDSGHGPDTFWDRFDRQEQRRTGVISIASNFGLSGGQSSSELEMRGASALALCDWLEALGYSVEIDGVITSLGHPGMHGPYHVTVPVKDAGQPVSESGMALICDGGIRRLIWWSHLVSCEERVSHGLGNPVTYRGERKYDVTVPRGIRTVEDARAWIVETVEWLKRRDDDPDAPAPTRRWYGDDLE